MCVLVDEELTAAAAVDTEVEMCAYAPTAVDEAAVEAGLASATEADEFTRSSIMGERRSRRGSER